MNPNNHARTCPICKTVFDWAKVEPKNRYRVTCSTTCAAEYARQCNRAKVWEHNALMTQEQWREKNAMYKCRKAAREKKQ